MNLEDYPDVKEAIERNKADGVKLTQALQEREDPELVALVTNFAKSQTEVLNHILSKLMANDMLSKAKGEKT